jgi:uncharacterized delta-60 repeat protein
MARYRRTLRGTPARPRKRSTQLGVEQLESRTLLSGDPSLTLTLASHSIPENAGPGATTGTVTRVNMDTSQPLTVQLQSSNPNQAAVPPSVLIPAGATSATFNVDAVDNQVVDPPQLVTITGWTASPLPPGLDTTFGIGGLASVTLKYSSSANFPGMALQPDGKIVAVASSQTSGATWSVTRTLPTGSPDTAFGLGGTVSTTFPGANGGYANAVAVQPDGKIVVVGTVNGVSVYDAWGIARYNADGTPDTNFGNQGLVLIKFTGVAGWLYDVAVLPDGHLLVGGMLQQPAGFTVARLTSTGALDTTFGSGGYASINPDPTHSWYNISGQAMVVQPDGKILVTGIANYNYLPVSRFNANGTVDTTFGTGGTALVPLSALGTGYTSAQGNDLAVQSDGKILVVGQAAHTSSSNSDFVIARLNPAGSLDTGFNGTGAATVDFAGGNDEAQAVAIQADGKIVLGGGAVVVGTGFFLALARLNADGTRDATFGNNGTLMTQPTVPFERIWDMALQPDGKLTTLAGYNTSMQVVRYDTGLLTASDRLTVTDTDSGPIANAGGPYTVPEGGSVVLDASGTTDANQDPSTLTYLWDLNGNGIYGETGSAATHGDEVGIHPTFLVNGLDGSTSVIAHLEVIDNQGLSGFAEATTNVTEVNPAIYPGGDTTLSEGGTLNRDGYFTDPGPDTWTATVDYGDGSGTQPLTLNSDKTFTLNHTYGDEGKYRVFVIVDDNEGNPTGAYFYVTVTDTAPQVQLAGNATIHDGGTYASAGSFSDAGPDTWTATVDYGDGSGAQPLTLNSDKTFDLAHRYTEEGTFSVTVTVADDDGTAGTETLSVTVDDPVPVVSAGSDTTMNEGGTYSGTGSFSDSSPDTWTASVNYGDGSGDQPLTLNADKTFSLSHVYTDNGSYYVTVTVSDDDGALGTDSFTVTANNVPPTVAVTGPSLVVRGQTATFSVTAQDPSPRDQAAGFAYTIAWGDGTSTNTSGPSTLSVGHVYEASGNYTVEGWATDKDGGKSVQPGTLAVAVSAAALENGDLYVGGTTASDTIILKPADRTGTSIAVTINGATIGTYHLTGQIIAYGQSGADSIQLQTARISNANVYVAVPSILYASTGNSTLSAAGSSAANILVGGAGNDSLTGGTGRDILIGGAGSDTLRSGSGGDILIGAATDYNANLVALAALRKEWARTDLAYIDRINHLTGATTGGYNGSDYLNTATVHDDAAVDYLYGGNGGDWYFAMTTGAFADVVSGRKKGEVLTALG